MAKIATFDPSMLTMQAANNQVNNGNSSNGQDFLQAINQAKSQMKQEKNPVTSLQDKKSQSPDIKEVREFKADKHELNTTNEPEEELPEIKDEMLISKDDDLKTVIDEVNPLEEIDDETLKEIQETFAEIMMLLEQMIGATGDDLKQIMEDMNIEFSDFVSSDITNIVLDIQKEDTVNLLTDENLFEEVSEITQKIESLLSKLETDNDLTPKDLQNILTALEEKPEPKMDVDLSQTLELDLDNTPKQIMDEKINTAPLELENNNPVIEENAPILTEMPELKEVKVEVKDYSKDKTLQDENKLTSSEDIDTTVENIEDTTTKTDKDTHKETKDDTSDNENHEQNTNSFSNTETPKFAQNMDNVSTDFSQNPYAKDVDPESVLRQISENVKVLKQNDETTLEFMLHPQSLGSVKIALSTKGGSITASFTAQNESIKTALENQVTQLRSNLEEQGIKVEAIEISVESHELEKNLDQKGQNSSEQQSKEQDEKVTKLRRKNINLRAWANGTEEEIEEALLDDDTRLTMEMMEMYGNSMDLFA